MAKNRKTVSGANWMDTYGDMVTLLLCFFVMMFSMSSVSEEKYQALVESFNPEATIEGFSEIIENPEDVQVGESEDPTQEQVEEDLQQLYEEVTAYAKAAGIERELSIKLGDGYVFISFQDAVFFDPDSYILRAEGEEVLDNIAIAIGQVQSSIDAIEVLGHTAQAVANSPNQILADRFLASDRATIITIYLQEKNIIEPARILSVGFGQWRPVTGNENEEERQQNRRVELVISGFTPDGEVKDELEEYYEMIEGGSDEIPTDLVDDTQDTAQSEVQSEAQSTAENDAENTDSESENSAEGEE